MITITMVMIIQGDENMIAIRRGVFETNSSSTHSLTLINSPHTSTSKLKSGGTYEGNGIAFKNWFFAGL